MKRQYGEVGGSDGFESYEDLSRKINFMFLLFFWIDC